MYARGLGGKSNGSNLGIDGHKAVGNATLVYNRLCIIHFYSAIFGRALIGPFQDI